MVCEDLEYIKPEIPGYDDGSGVLHPYPYIAGVCINKSDLQKVCVKTAQVIGISSVEDNTVTIEYGGEEYSDIPVWIHTDYGCRGRKMTEGEEDPDVYFSRAALLFPVGSSVTLKKALSSTTFSTVAPIVTILVIPAQSDTEPERILGVVGIVQNLSARLRIALNLIDGDNGELWPTWRLYFSIKHRTLRHTVYWDEILQEFVTDIDVANQLVLYDPITDSIARIPDAGYTQMIDAVSDDFNAFDYFLTKAFTTSGGESVTVTQPLFPPYSYIISQYIDFEGAQHSPAWMVTNSNPLEAVSLWSEVDATYLESNFSRYEYIPKWHYRINLGEFLGNSSITTLYIDHDGRNTRHYLSYDYGRTQESLNSGRILVEVAHTVYTYDGYGGVPSSVELTRTSDYVHSRPYVGGYPSYVIGFREQINAEVSTVSHDCMNNFIYGSYLFLNTLIFNTTRQILNHPEDAVILPPPPLTRHTSHVFYSNNKSFIRDERILDFLEDILAAPLGTVNQNYHLVESGPYGKNYVYPIDRVEIVDLKAVLIPYDLREAGL